MSEPNIDLTEDEITQNSFYVNDEAWMKFRVCDGERFGKHCFHLIGELYFAGCTRPEYSELRTTAKEAKFEEELSEIMEILYGRYRLGGDHESHDPSTVEGQFSHGVNRMEQRLRDDE